MFVQKYRFSVSITHNNIVIIVSRCLICWILLILFHRHIRVGHKGYENVNQLLVALQRMVQIVWRADVLQKRRLLSYYYDKYRSCPIWLLPPCYLYNYFFFFDIIISLNYVVNNKKSNNYNKLIFSFQLSHDICFL